ncbi:transcription initiation factor IIB [Aeropyrum pernix]|uniref:Transcription initiation factor IIB n=2 Tax=Aeropyrum pernix TaxID=56636 RepID=A0A401HBK0_AERPX|nr:transcription initiation factor IIB [Aeropyrum pernix]
MLSMASEIPYDEGPSGEESGEIKCKNIVTDPVRGLKICADTGEIIGEDIIGTESDVKAYTPEERQQKTHYGGPLKYSHHYMGVEASLEHPRDHGPKGIKQRKILPRRPPRLSARPLTSVDKNLQTALSLINEVASRMGMPEIVVEDASKIYREAMEKGLTRGRSIESIVAASLYAASRIHGLPHSLTDIIKAMKGNVDAETRRDVARSYRLLVRDLNIKIPVRKPENFVYTIISALGLPEHVAIEAIKIIDLSRKKGLTAGKDPGGLAGAAVYLAALKHGIRKTQKEIAHVVGVTEVTIRNRYKEIAQALGIEEELEEKGGEEKG